MKTHIHTDAFAKTLVDIARAGSKKPPTYNDAIDDAAKVACPDKKPCDCIHKDHASGFWMQDCYCQNHGDLASAASWCSAANTAEAIRALRR